ncbi:uncharacterized protein V6R79_001666 [Siganus canaliculatus]
MPCFGFGFESKSGLTLLNNGTGEVPYVPFGTSSTPHYSYMTENTEQSLASLESDECPVFVPSRDMTEVMINSTPMEDMRLSPSKDRLSFQIFPDPSDFDRCCKLKDRLPSIVVEPTEGEVESGELRWPPEEFLHSISRLADTCSVSPDATLLPLTPKRHSSQRYHANR